MTHTDCITFIRDTNSFRDASHTLSPAAEEAKKIIPKNIVKERARLYGVQINQQKASEGNTERINTVYRHVTNDSETEETHKNNDTSLQDNNKTYKATFTNLPEEIKEVICTFLDLASLKNSTKISKEI